MRSACALRHEGVFSACLFNLVTGMVRGVSDGSNLCCSPQPRPLPGPVSTPEPEPVVSGRVSPWPGPERQCCVWASSWRVRVWHVMLGRQGRRRCCQATLRLLLREYHHLHHLLAECSCFMRGRFRRARTNSRPPRVARQFSK